MQIDEVIFLDTTVEFPQMYEHIEKVEQYIGRKITKLKADFDFEHYMFDHVKTRGKNKGKAGYGWSDFRNRWCTTVLKTNVIKKYMRNKYKDFQVVEYHGIALDEIERTENNKDGRAIKYPLVEWKMVEQQALEYCYSKGFYWDGLYDKFDRVSCYLCPLQRLSELRAVFEDYPDLWSKMKELDNKAIKMFNRKFRSDYSIEELERKFIRESEK